MLFRGLLREGRLDDFLWQRGWRANVPPSPDPESVPIDFPWLQDLRNEPHPAAVLS